MLTIEEPLTKPVQHEYKKEWQATNYSNKPSKMKKKWKQMRILKVIVKWSWTREFVCIILSLIYLHIINTKITHTYTKRVVLFISTIITTITLIANNIKFGTSNITHVSKIEKFHHNFTAVSWFLVLFCSACLYFIPFHFNWSSFLIECITMCCCVRFFLC